MQMSAPIVWTLRAKVFHSLNGSSAGPFPGNISPLSKKECATPRVPGRSVFRLSTSRLNWLTGPITRSTVPIKRFRWPGALPSPKRLKKGSLSCLNPSKDMRFQFHPNSRQKPSDWSAPDADKSLVSAPRMTGRDGTKSTCRCRHPKPATW